MTNIDRLLRTFTSGTRVRADLDIIYGTGEEVAEGALGIVVSAALPGPSPGVYLVKWDGQAEPLPTTADCFD